MTDLVTYIGLWRDYSNEGVYQSTLTLPTNWGNYLTSATALLVSLAISCVWTIIAYALHQFRVNPNKQHDPIYHQIQIILRNSVTPGSAISDSCWVAQAWAGTSTAAGLWVWFIVVLGLLCLIISPIVGTFVSSVATMRDADVTVLSRSNTCGGWALNSTAVYADEYWNPETLRIVVNDALEARLYAKWFYAAEDPLAVPSSRFPVKSLSYTAKEAPCPFEGDERCIISINSSSPNAAMIWDTGRLNSHFELGMNAPPSDRIDIRRVLTCSPVNVSDLVDITNTSGVTHVNLTRLVGFSDELNSQALTHHRGRLTRWLTQRCRGYSFSGAVKRQPWAAPFDRDDVDIAFLYIMQNSVTYPQPVYDPMFLATGSRVWVYDDGSKGYFGDNPLNMMACYEQSQFCTPKTDKCTSLTHPAAAWAESQSMGFNTRQQTLVNRTAMLMGLAGVAEYGVGSLGPSGLLARDLAFSSIVSTSLPADQWKKEVTLWFETRLASLQAHFLRFQGRIDLSSPDRYGNYLIYEAIDEMPSGPLRDAAEHACQNQKFTTTGQYQNFRFFELMLIITISFCLIVSSTLLEPALALARRHWSTRTGRSRQLARDEDNKFWLLRLALENAGVGPWRRGGRAKNSHVPIVDRSMLMVHEGK
ncbi:hypothetical protein EDB81DRAFT_670601 [Dactylonectria macrodidyma]|uniref:Uncharacterized protein n=1 Tax=Dactylonectria macrodidyma TaxID=307937 RepID=A0A9P9D4U4_9HYPO|nr:hypothetical protein EDB81DRAFT_670601 [Dactylonectria macrodidyma]